MLCRNKGESIFFVFLSYTPTICLSSFVNLEEWKPLSVMDGSSSFLLGKNQFWRLFYLNGICYVDIKVKGCHQKQKCRLLDYIWLRLKHFQCSWYISSEIKANHKFLVLKRCHQKQKRRLPGFIWLVWKNFQSSWYFWSKNKVKDKFLALVLFVSCVPKVLFMQRGSCIWFVFF